MAALDLKSEFWLSDHNVHLYVDLFSVMLLFFLIYSFYKLSGSLRYDAFEEQEQKELGKTLPCKVEALLEHWAILPVYHLGNTKLRGMGNSNLQPH